jgi:integrase
VLNLRSVSDAEAEVNREMALLKALFNYYPSLTNPVNGKGRFLDEDNLQNRTLSYEEEAVYLACCSQPLKDVATIIIQTGMRPEEVYRIKVENISVNANDPFLFNPKGKTAAARRNVPLNTIALEVITRRLNEVSGKTEYLFPSPADPSKPVLKLNNAHYGAMRRSGLKPFRLYDLRHTWATRMALSGIDPVTLRTMLGHSEKCGLRLVERYVHPPESHHFEAAKNLEEYNKAQAIREAERQSISATVN